MPRQLFDSSIYIHALRKGQDAGGDLRRLESGGAVWLSAVVLEELYAGARGSHQFAVERLEQQFVKSARLLVPSREDWVHTGKLLAQLAVKYGYEQIGRGRLTNDALIATSSGRLGIEIVTTNARDFSRLAEFSSFRWRVEKLLN
jgi:predicted nucleic acid-binding protein